MKRNKKWKKIVQTAILLVLVTVLACPLSAIAQTVNEVNEKSEVAEEKDSNTKTEPQEDTQTENNVEEDPEATEEKDSNTEDPQPVTPQIKDAVNGKSRLTKANNNGMDPKIQALIQALGGTSYASASCSDDQCNVILRKSATVNSGTLTIPQGVGLIVDGSDKTLTVGASVNFVIENGGYVSLYDGSFMKVDCAISGTKEAILLGEGSSISALSSLEKFPNGFIVPLLPYEKHGKVVNCTDWKNERTVYAPVVLEELEDPEGFIIKADGRGMAYELLGWNSGSAFDKSEAGDTIYLLNDFKTGEKTDGDTEGINSPLKRGVTLVIKKGQTFSIGIWSLMIMANPGLVPKLPRGEGTIIALAGSVCEMPWNLDAKRTPFIGTDEELTLLKLDKGVCRLELPQAMVSPTRLFAAPQAAAKAAGVRPAHVILTENSQGTFCNPLYLRLANDGMDCTVGENATLTVKSLLVVDGNQKLAKNSPSNLTLNKNATLRTQGNKGIIYLDALTKTYLQEGASFSADSIDGDITLKEDRKGFQSFFKGLLSVGPNAGLELQNQKLFGRPDAYMSVKAGTAEVTLGKAPSETEPSGEAPNLLKLTSGSEAVLNNDWKFELISEKSPFNNYLKDLTIEDNSTFTLNATLTIPKGATLNLDGTLVIGPNGKLILEDGSTLNNNGNINVQPGGEVSGGSSFKLTPFQNKDFRAEQEGYTSPETLDVAVESNGTQPTGNLTASLSGSNADSFSLTPSGDLGSLTPDDGSKNLTVSPKTGLKEGTYTAEVTVSNGQLSATFPVSFTVKKGSSGGDTPGTDDPNANNNSKPASSKVQPTPNTADNSPVMSWAILMMLSLIVGSTTFWGYRRKKREIR